MRDDRDAVGRLNEQSKLGAGVQDLLVASRS
jgi:hypothetical protein